MQAFGAVYTPRRYDESGIRRGYQSDKTEDVIVLDVYPTIPGITDMQHQVAIVRGDGNYSLDVVPLDCITQCQALSLVELIGMDRGGGKR